MPKKVLRFSYTEREMLRLFVADLQRRDLIPKTGKGAVEVEEFNGKFEVTVEVAATP